MQRPQLQVTGGHGRQTVIIVSIEPGKIPEKCRDARSYAQVGIYVRTLFARVRGHNAIQWIYSNVIEVGVRACDLRRVSGKGPMMMLMLMMAMMLLTIRQQSRIDARDDDTHKYAGTRSHGVGESSHRDAKHNLPCAHILTY